MLKSTFLVAEKPGNEISNNRYSVSCAHHEEPRWIQWKLSPVFVTKQKLEERVIHLSVHFFVMRSTCNDVLILLPFKFAMVIISSL